MLAEATAADSVASWAVSLAPGGWTDRLDRAVQAGHGLPVWAALAAVTALAGPSGRRAAATGLVAAAAGSGMANGLKPLVHRHRPRSLLHQPSRRTASFPSSHTAAGTAFAAGAGLEWAPSLVFTAPAVGAVAFSRVHSRQHHVGDVAAGLVVGALVGAAVGLVARRARRHRTAVDRDVAPRVSME
jgi:membrane-associated phospholipid phosphatase